MSVAFSFLQKLSGVFLKRTLLLLVVLFTLLAPLYSNSSAQLLISADDHLNTRIHNLFLLRGVAAPPETGGRTKNHLNYLLDRMSSSYSNSDDFIQNLEESIRDELNESARFDIEDGIASIDLYLEYGLEAYVHSNITTFTVDNLWNPRWVDRLPIISIPVSFAINNRFAGQVEFLIKQKLLDSPSERTIYSSHFFTNHSIEEFVELDFTWPYKAVATTGGNLWSLTLGRDRLTFGLGKTGNLLISDHLPYHEFIQFKTWFGNFEFTTAVLGFPSPAEIAGDQSLQKIKALILHRFDWRVFSKWHIAITESMMYQDHVLDFRFLNPMMIYHQYFMANRSNSLAVIETWLTPIKGLSIYGQFALDDVRVLSESEAIPNAFGWLINSEYALSTQLGIFNFWVEYVHTDPYLYMRDGIDFVVAFKTLTPSSGSLYVQNYLGYPQGGDTNVYSFGMEWDSLDFYRLYANFAYITRGEVDFNSPFPPPNSGAKTPTGIPQITLRASLGGNTYLKVGKFGFKDSRLELMTNVSFYWIKNLNNVVRDYVFDIQATFGAKYVL